MGRQTKEIDLYFRYLEERQPDKKVISSEKGFIIYSFTQIGTKLAIYVEDIYVTPEHRKNNVAVTLAEKVASQGRESGCELMLGTVVPSAKGSTISLKVLLAYGMQLLQSKDDIIWFYKEL